MLNPIKELLYPFKLFGFQIECEEEPQWYFELCCSERLIFRSTLLLASAANDLMSRQPLSRDTRKHLQSTLPLLNQRLFCGDEDSHGITLFAIVILAAIAVIFDDHNAVKAHALGISKIIRLQGGLKFLSLNTSIQLSIDRYELMTYKTGLAELLIESD